MNDVKHAFTWFLPSGEVFDTSKYVQFGVSFDELLRRNSDVGWYAFQPEVCPESGRDHIQGCYVVRSRSHAIDDWRVRLQDAFPGIHLESMRKGDHRNLLYCTKSESRKVGICQLRLVRYQRYLLLEERCLRNWA